MKKSPSPTRIKSAGGKGGHMWGSRGVWDAWPALQSRWCRFPGLRDTRLGDGRGAGTQWHAGRWVSDGEAALFHIVPYSGPGVPFLVSSGHYVINDVSKVGKELWVGTSTSKNNASLWRTGSWSDGWGGAVQVDSASKTRARLLTREDIHTSPSAPVQLRAGNNLKSSAPCPHHLQEGD